MHKPEPTKEELQTLASYQTIARVRAKDRNPNFWRQEFELFRSLLPQGNILDIGCGSGRDAALFVEADYAYVGIDLSPAMLSVAKERFPSTNFLLMDMYDLALPKNSFDGFWASASLLHIPKRNVAHVLNEIKNVIKTNGIGFIALKEGQGERMVRGKYDEDRFFSFYEEEEFSAILAKNGFTVLSHARNLQEIETSQNPDIWLTCFVQTQ